MEYCRMSGYCSWIRSQRVLAELKKSKFRMGKKRCLPQEMIQGQFCRRFRNGHAPYRTKDFFLQLLHSRFYCYHTYIVQFNSFCITAYGVRFYGISSLMYQLCEGVAFCHSHGVLHRLSDLKPHNLLMDRKTFMLKVVDLGLARAFTVPLKEYTHKVSLIYRNTGVLALLFQKYRNSRYNQSSTSLECQKDCVLMTHQSCLLFRKGSIRVTQLLKMQNVKFLGIVSSKTKATAVAPMDIAAITHQGLVDFGTRKDEYM
ncbi:cyclin-dependent kinase [Artemisia annua]|uniref:Cyclin-dependent kinase n=1 Tax=Artemisia annua TaxID=35608 RepID=A0A2U1KG42_ARTAN|nr:cyclin-dependent kinase [Artemisia annua]